MSVCLKNQQNAIQDWLSNYKLKYVHIAKNGVDQTQLDPYQSKIIIIYKETENRIYLQGWMEYGSETINPMQTLQYYREVEHEENDVIEFDMQEIEPTWDLVKAHIDGEFFSLETLQILLSAGYVKPPYKLVQYLYRFAPFLELIEPTVQDLQRYYKINPRVRPLTWFNVPMEDITGNFILYRGGYFHVAALEMDNWIFKHLMRNLKPSQFDVMSYVNSKVVYKRRKHIDLSEIRLAPCIDIQDHFPTDRERQNMVRVFSNANVPLEYVRDKLEDLNNRFPKNGLTLKKRWDYEAHYKGNYAPFKCEYIDCPLGKDLGEKKNKCYKLFKERYNKEPNHKSFYGPLSWFEW
jgi:hypothetical protein